jgi:signal transduction histidine kinase
MSTHHHPGSEFAAPVPAADWYNPESAAHVVQFYQDDHFLLDELSRFIGGALVAGDFGIVLATEGHRRGIAQRLRSRGLDVAVAVEQGRYIALDAETTLANLMVDGSPDTARVVALSDSLMARVKLQSGNRQPQVRIFGEMVVLLWVQGNREAALRLERIWTDLARRYGFSLRCAYPIGEFDRAEDSQPFLQVCAEHSGVIPAESYVLLADEAARLRQLTHLQQQAQALEAEVAERIAVEQRLRRREAELLRSQKMAETGRLAATIAHEINNPLESLTNLFYLLQSHPSLEGTARYWADLAGQELKRIAHITKQMLAFYRVSAQPVSFSLAEVLDEVLDMFQQKLAARQIQVEKQYSSEGMLQGFPTEMRQLFANLLGNAMEASDKNGKLRIHLYQTSDWRGSGRRGIRVSIGDQGSGIAVEHRKKIFEPFFTTKGEAGTGLGLWVSRGIVEKCGGAIRLRSSAQPGRSGTVFSVFLPLVIAGQPDTAALVESKIVA